MTDYVVLDTDVFSEALRGNLPVVTDPQLSGRVSVLTFVSVAELYYGAWAARWGEARLRELSDRIDATPVLPYDSTVPVAWAQLRDKARRAGHPLANAEHANDLWIAACAVSFKAPLWTFNRRHFDYLPGLMLVGPERPRAGRAAPDRPDGRLW